MKELYKVVIVDDEAFAREALEFLVNWENLGFELVGSAENGKQALEIIAEYQPDLVITDIAMPEMSGMELIAYVREHMHFQPKFVILSAYGTFDYAKEAMRLGVENYILKPIIRREVTQKLADIKEDMDREKRERAVREKTDRSLANLSCSYLSRFLNGVAEEEELYKLELILNLQERQRRMLAVKGIRSREVLMLALQNEHLVPEPYEIMFLTSDFAAVVLDFEKEGLGKQMIHALTDVRDTAYVVMDLGLVGSRREIGEAWKLVTQVMDYCFYREKRSRVFCQEDREWLEKQNALYCHEILEEPEEENFRDCEQVSNYCAALRGRNIEPRQLRIIVLARLIAMKDETGEQLKWQVSWMFFEELRDIWMQIIREKKESIDKNQTGSQITVYIQEHFHENITIQDMAGELCYNEVYLGKLVKKETGMTFRQYLNKVRLEYAEKCLRESSDSVIEISMDSGFSNPDYFYRKFREKNGMTPTEFRKR